MKWKFLTFEETKRINKIVTYEWACLIYKYFLYYLLRLKTVYFTIPHINFKIFYTVNLLLTN